MPNMHSQNKIGKTQSSEVGTLILSSLKIFNKVEPHRCGCMIKILG